ncbi:MAG TPA: hypothetical protein VL242_15470 [Sorangium sp.]|nr:hypothetical protein [Sorangium sp.]
MLVNAISFDAAWSEPFKEAATKPRMPITLINREMNRQDAKNAKIGFFSWRSWRLGGSIFCAFEAVSTRLSL